MTNRAAKIRTVLLGSLASVVLCLSNWNQAWSINLPNSTDEKLLQTLALTVRGNDVPTDISQASVNKLPPTPITKELDIPSIALLLESDAEKILGPPASTIPSTTSKRYEWGSVAYANGRLVEVNYSYKERPSNLREALDKAGLRQTSSPIKGRRSYFWNTKTRSFVCCGFTFESVLIRRDFSAISVRIIGRSSLPNPNQSSASGGSASASNTAASGSHGNAGEPGGGLQKITIIAITFVLSIIGALIARVIFERYESHRNVKVKQITSTNDTDVHGFVGLYSELIDESERIDSAEIVRWIDEERLLRKSGPSSYCHYLLVGKLGGRVVSFLKAMYCSQCTYLYIAYYGIDTTIERARSGAAPAMMNKVLNLIKKEIPNCKGLICEVQAPSTELDEKENTKRRSRVKFFRDMARRLGYNMYQVGIDYLRPQMEVTHDRQFAEVKMMLLYVPIKTSVPPDRQVPKQLVLEMLSFVYLRIYGPTFRHEPEKDLAYRAYLKSLLQLYEGVLPDSIPLRD